MPKAPPLAELIRMDLIDPPARPMRETMDPEALEKLVESIASVGLIVPIVLKPIEGGRYEIVDGHRRFIACTAVQMDKIPALIKAPGGVSLEALKMHANLHRADVNPAEEAQFLSILLEQDAGGDVDRLCEMFRLRRQYVEDRLLLLQGDPEIIQAVREGAISFSVAKELNKCEPRSLRLVFLESAISGGASARVVIGWRTDAARNGQMVPPVNGTGENQHSDTPAPIMRRQCCVCGDSERQFDFEYIVVHRTSCRKMLDRAMRPIREAIGEPDKEQVENAGAR